MHDREDDEDEKLFVEMQRATANLPPRRKGKARRDAFVKVPLWWFEAATRATGTPQAFVCIWLLHLAWKKRNTTFPLSNAQLADSGAERRAKRRALANLEKAGLITVDRHHGRAPRVTLTVL